MRPLNRANWIIPREHSLPSSSLLNKRGMLGWVLPPSDFCGSFCRMLLRPQGQLGPKQYGNSASVSLDSAEAGILVESASSDSMP